MNHRFKLNLSYYNKCMELIHCPYLNGYVELSPEREAHIAIRHPELLPKHRERIVETLGAPEQVRRSTRFGNARIFSRWFSDVKNGKFVVVVVVSESSTLQRHWIITSYLARHLAEGVVEWKQN